MLSVSANQGWKLGRRATSCRPFHQTPHKSGQTTVPKSLFREDSPEPRSQGFFARWAKKWKQRQYDSTQAKLQRKIYELEPQVKATMARKDIENLTRDERDAVAEWMALNQDHHTFRRRKFMADSAERIEESSRRYPTPWEIRKGELEQEVKEFRLNKFPGGDVGRLWSEEAKYRQAEEYSRMTQRLHLTEHSMDTSVVASESTRIHHLEPALPPSYQARAAAALKLEGKAYNKEDNDHLQHLVERSSMEVPLDEALRRHSPTRRLKSLWSFTSVRQYSTSPPPQTPNPDEQFSPIPSNPPKDTYVNRIRQWFAKNGPLGVTLYLSYSAIDLTIIYMLLSAGVDVSSLLSLIGIESGAGAATFAVAYALHKMLAPPRAALVVLTLPYIKPAWDRLVSVVEVKEAKHHEEVRTRKSQHSED